MGGFLRSVALPKLEQAEVVELIGKAQKGDKRARDRLIRSHIPFVLSEARKHSRTFDDVVEDLESEGLIGLDRAIDSFDAAKGVTFLTYASHWIRARVRRELADSAVVHVPTGSPLAETMAVRSGTVSMDGLAEDGLGSASIFGAPAAQQPEAQVAEAEGWADARVLIEKLLGELPTAVRQVAMRRLLSEDPPTIEALAKEFGMKREAVRKMEVRAMAHLRRRIGAAPVDGEDLDDSAEEQTRECA
jgi:RNA polymerase sigma factor (sigma-70 family)